MGCDALQLGEYGVATSLHSWDCVFLRSRHGQQFQKITRYGHMFSIQVLITALIWTRLRHGLFHSCPSYPAILQRTVHQHIMLSQLDNTLLIERTCDGHGVSSSKSRPQQHVTIRFGHCERELFSTPPSNSCRQKQLPQNVLSTPNCQHKKTSRKTWAKITVCVQNGGEYTDNISLASRGALWTLCSFRNSGRILVRSKRRESRKTQRHIREKWNLQY